MWWGHSFGAGVLVGLALALLVLVLGRLVRCGALLVTLPGLAALADGAGGHAAGVAAVDGARRPH
eukprot:8725626-Alexandrium_andersonii.AAC.1